MRTGCGYGQVSSARPTFHTVKVDAGTICNQHNRPRNTCGSGQRAIQKLLIYNSCLSQRYFRFSRCVAMYARVFAKVPLQEGKKVNACMHRERERREGRRTGPVHASHSSTHHPFPLADLCTLSQTHTHATRIHTSTRKLHFTLGRVRESEMTRKGFMPQLHPGV